VADTLLDECAGCGGVWIDANAFERLVKNRDAELVIAERGGPCLDLESAALAKPVPNGPMYVPCPDCGHLMNRKNFSGTSGVIIDVCKPHGIWFDRNELGRIMSFVMNGGLEAARRQELERMNRQIKEAQTRLGSIGSAPGTSDSEGTRIEQIVAVLRAFLG